MSHRIHTVTFTTVLALMLALTAARGQTAPTTTTTTTTAPEELVDNPHFLAWTTHKPGTEVHLELITETAGQKMVTNITQRLVEVTAEKAVVESVARMNIPGFDAKPQAQTLTFDARVPKSQAERATMPMGGEGSSKELGKESVEAAGKTYECQVSEFAGKVQGSDAKGKQWRTSEIPGGLAKMEASSGGMKVNLVVTKVTEGK
jgi:hypothetical protein